MCVHTRHCCSRHGCKYRDKDCPVVIGISKQEYSCELCDKEKRTKLTNSNSSKEIWIDRFNNIIEW